MSLARLFPALTDEAVVLTDIADADGSAGAEIRAVVDLAAPGVFRTAGIRVLQGRDFTWHDDENGPKVAIVNASAASRLFPGKAVIGGRIRIGMKPALRSVEVVGLVADATMGNVRSPHVPVVVTPSLQDLKFARHSGILIRTDAQGEALNRAVQRTVTSLGLDYVASVQPARERLQASIKKERLLAAFAFLFGGTAMTIAFVGVFGLLALDVSRRQRELGVRIALGASRGRIVRGVIVRALAIAGGGVVIGVPGALALTKFGASVLYGLAGTDLAMVLASAGLLGSVAVAGSLAPALRAAAIDAMLTLRSE